MTIQKWLDRVKGQFLDDTREPELFDEADAVDALNDVLHDVLAECRLIKDTLTEAICEIEVTASGYVGYSAISDRIIVVDEVLWVDATNGTVTLDLETMPRLRVRTPEWRDTDAGVPEKYLLDAITGYIMPYPKPELDGTLYLGVYRTTIADLTMDDVEDEIPIKSIYHHKLFNGALRLLYQKKDTEVFDRLSERYEALYAKDLDYIKRMKLKYEHREVINTPLKGLM